MKITLATAFIFLLTATTSFAEEAPSYKPSRQDEDWSALRDKALRTDPWDSIKFIPLNSDGSAWMTFGGEVRERFEYYDQANWGKGVQDSNGYLLQRYMLSADTHVSEEFRLFTEFQGGLEDGRNGGPRGSDRDALDAHQLFADVRLPFAKNNSLTLRLGRQELAFGSQRLVSLRDSPNLRRTFDGARATLMWEGWQFDAFATRPVRLKTGVFDDDTDLGTKFWGFYGVAPFSPVRGGHVDFYYFGLDRDEATFAQSTAHERRHSIGTRLWGKNAGWDWNHEFVYQFGSFGSGDICAWTAATDIGYTFSKATLSPRFGIKADLTSGDRDPKNKDLQTFNPLFPKGGYFAETGLIGPQNHIDLHPSVELHPSESVKISADIDFFWRESTHDGVYNIGQVPLRTGTNGGSSYVGSQATVQIEWKIQKHLTWTANYAHFFSGAFLHENLPDKDVNYFASWLSYRF
jgi:Alginate export